MDCRALIVSALTVLVVPFGADAQPAGRRPAIGFLSFGFPATVKPQR
jgi:hypothetical protein